MKYLKHIFEDNEYEFYGLSPEDVKDMFIELQDEGWLVRVNFTKKLFQFNQSGVFNKEDIKLNLKPHIEVRIKRFNERLTSRQTVDLEISELTNSLLFKEVISVAKERLSYFGWEMKDIKREEDYLIISIYKINI